MTYLILISSLLYLAGDNLAHRYYTKGPIIYSELAKVSFILFAISIAYGGYMYAKTPHFEYIISWFLFHFVIQQVGCGLIRKGNPLYLGSGWFDTAIRFVTGGTWYMYVLLLGLATFIAIHLL